MRRRGTLLLDLRVELDDLWRGVDNKRRKEIRHSDKMGFEIDFSPDTVKQNAWSALYRELLKHINQPFDEDNIHGMMSRGDHMLITASYHGTLLSGELFYTAPAWTDPSQRRFILRWSATARYSDETRRMAALAHTLLVWKSIEWAKIQGFVEYDFGGWNNLRPEFAGVNAFKESFGGNVWWTLTSEPPLAEQLDAEKRVPPVKPEDAIIWFDDGHKSVHDIALPLFKTRGLKAIVAIVTGSVGKNLEASAEKEYPIMDVKDLRDLVDAGWEIASHSVSHPYFPSLPVDRARRELADSKQWIIDELGVTPTKFAAPFGGLTPEQTAVALEYYPYLRPLIPPRPPQPNGIHAIIHRIITKENGNQTWTNAVPVDPGFTNFFFRGGKESIRDNLPAPSSMPTEPNELNTVIYNTRTAVRTYESQLGLHNIEVEPFKDLVPPGKALDMGCGAGRTTIWLHDRGFDVIGVDISKRMIQRAQQLYPHLDFRVGDAVKPDFPPESFDCILFSYNGIDNIYPESNRVTCLREMRRILKPNGTFVFSSHNETWRRLHPDRVDPYEPPYYWYQASYGRIIICFISREEQRGQLEEAGFALKSVYGNDKNAPWLYYVATPKS